MSEKKGRASGISRRVTWADAVVILLLLGGVFLGGFILRSRGAAAESAGFPIVYTLRLEDVSKETWETSAPQCFAVGAPVTNAKGSVFLGKVLSVEATASRVTTVREGEVVFVEREDRVDLTVRVRAEAHATAGEGWRVSDLRIAAFATGDFRVGGWMMYGARILSVEREGTA